MRLINFFAIDKVLSYEKFENDQTQTLSLPEVCFAGRSNVGKSTLLNTLVGKAKAKVGNEPAVTKGQQPTNHLKILGNNLRFHQ